MIRALLAAALSLSALSVPAAAAPPRPAERGDGPPVRIRNTVTSFHLRGPEGERLVGAASRRSLSLTIEAGDTAVSYFARGSVSPDGIHVELGRFGAVDVTFDARGRSRFVPVPGPCDGGTEIQPGVVAGTIRFDGDAGYAPVSATSASASIARTKITCRPSVGPAGSGQGPRATFLTANDGHDRTIASTQFAAIQQDNKDRAEFFASTLGHEGDVNITRSAFVRGPREAFTVGPRRRRATVTPPAPFSGSATLTRSDRGATWVGDLAVTFPGQQPTALTGARFKAQLDRAALLRFAGRNRRAWR